MLKERDDNEITQEVRNFLSNPSVDVVVYPVGDSKIEHEKINMLFCAAAYVNDEEGASLDFVTFVSDGKHSSSSKFQREIFEWDIPNSGALDNIDGWLASSRKAHQDAKPLLAISFGVYENTKKRGVFVHAREGVTLNSAIVILKRYAEINLFGKEFNLKVDL